MAAAANNPGRARPASSAPAPTSHPRAADRARRGSPRHRCWWSSPRSRRRPRSPRRATRMHPGAAWSIRPSASRYAAPDGSAQAQHRDAIAVSRRRGRFATRGGVGVVGQQQDVAVIESGLSQQPRRPRDGAIGATAIDRHDVGRQRIEEQARRCRRHRSAARRCTHRRRRPPGQPARPRAPAAASRSWRAPAAGARAAGRRRASPSTGRARSPTARGSATRLRAARARTARRARTSPARRRAVPATASARARVALAWLRADAAAGADRRHSRQSLRCRRRARHHHASSGNASSSHNHCGRSQCRSHATCGEATRFMRAPASATRMRAGRSASATPAATDSVRCVGARSGRALDRFQPIDLGVDAGELFGVARAECLAAGESSRCAAAWPRRCRRRHRAYAAECRTPTGDRLRHRTRWRGCGRLRRARARAALTGSSMPALLTPSVSRISTRCRSAVAISGA